MRITFLEDGLPVYDILGPFSRYFADLMCVDMAGGITRGGRWVHVERAIVEPWLRA